MDWQSGTPRSYFDGAQHERSHTGEHPHPSPLPSRERGLDTPPPPGMDSGSGGWGFLTLGGGCR